MTFLHGLMFALGIYPAPSGTPWTYQLWSGFIPALAVMSLIGGVGTIIRRHNCHIHGCWRTGSYPVGEYRVCKRHHDDIRPRTTVSKLKDHHILHIAIRRNQAGFPPKVRLWDVITGTSRDGAHCCSWYWSLT